MRQIVLLVILFLLSPYSAHAASMYLSPASLSLGAGQSGTFTVFVESASQAMNAVSGNISVDASGASVTSVSKTSSIVNFWASEPTFSGSTVSFEGVVLSPGYTGSAGKVISFTVRANCRHLSSTLPFRKRACK